MVPMLSAMKIMMIMSNFLFVTMPNTMACGFHCGWISRCYEIKHIHLRQFHSSPPGAKINDFMQQSMESLN